MKRKHGDNFLCSRQMQKRKEASKKCKHKWWCKRQVKIVAIAKNAQNALDKRKISKRKLWQLDAYVGLAA